MNPETQIIQNQVIQLPKLGEEEIRLLQEPFPEEALKPVDVTKAQDESFMLTSIKAAYVVERLNIVFGVGRWDVPYEIVRDDEHGLCLNGTLMVKDFDVVVPAQFGFAKYDKNQMGKMYKSAVTSLMKKCASYLGVGKEVYMDKVDPRALKKRKQAASGQKAKVSAKEDPKRNILREEQVSPEKWMEAGWNGQVYPYNKNFMAIWLKVEGKKDNVQFFIDKAVGEKIADKYQIKQAS